MSRADKLPSQTSATGDVAAFLEKVAKVPMRQTGASRGRLIFAIDATASREPTWDMACQVQADMFAETDTMGGLDIQPCFYRGFGEFKKTEWLDSAAALIERMVRVRCLAGRTQIAKLLRHAAKQTRAKKVDALIFIGDAVEEDVDGLGHLAGQLGLLGTPGFHIS